jgi:hypothetical protein
MAPEQAVGAPDVDGRADLYSLAAVAFEALTGTRADTLRDAEYHERMLRSARPDLPLPVVRAMARPLAIDRDQRPASVAVWLDEVRTGTAPDRTRRFVLGLTVATIAITVAVAMWRMSGPAPSPASGRKTVAVLPLEVAGAPWPGTPPDLANGVSEQLDFVPGYEVIRPGRVSRVIGAAFPQGPSDFDTLLAVVAAGLQAQEVVSGRAVLDGTGSLMLSLRVHDGAQRRLIVADSVRGQLDSLGSLISQLIEATFAPRVASELTGWHPRLPCCGGTLAYLEASTLMRRAAYDSAIARYNRVIQLDSTYARAYFDRMLSEILRLQPTRASGRVREAVDAARRYGSGLDATTRELLSAYERVVTGGDLDSAYQRLQALTEEYPDAAEAWFLQGFLEFYFGPLIGITTWIKPQLSLSQAYRVDPSFAAVVGHLGYVYSLREMADSARHYFREYRAIDSTSVWSRLIGMVDSLLYGTDAAKGQVLRTLSTRDAATLEVLLMATDNLRARPVEREVQREAVRALRERAGTAQDRAIALRFEAATLAGSKRLARLDAALQAARRSPLPPEAEIDAWVVLGAVTGTVPSREDIVTAAAARLARRDSDETAYWLAARWFRDRDRPGAARARDALDRIARGVSSSPLAVSLADDLRAHDALARGDTTEALDLWRRATRRYGVEHVLFGLVGSLWPLRLDMARVAAAADSTDLVLRATAPFETPVGFNDQVAWYEALLLRAEAFRSLGMLPEARETYRALRDVLVDADGGGTTLRDSVAARLQSLSGR